MSRVPAISALHTVTGEVASFDAIVDLASVVTLPAVPSSITDLPRGAPLGVTPPSRETSSPSDLPAVRRQDAERLAAALGVSEPQAVLLLSRTTRELAERGIDLAALIDELAATNHPAVATAVPVLLVNPELASLIPGLEPQVLESELDTRLMAHAAAHFASTLFQGVDARELPLERAVRLGVLAAPRLIELSPAEQLMAPMGAAVFLAQPGSPRLDDYGLALVAGLAYAQPRAFLDVEALTTLHDEARRHVPVLAHSRVEQGLREAAWLTVRRTSDAATADAITQRATEVTSGAMPRVVLSAASLSRHDDDTPSAVRNAVERLKPGLAEYERAIAAFPRLMAIPPAQLCELLHVQLTRAPDQVFLALLSLLRRQSVWCTRRGILALRKASRTQSDLASLGVEGLSLRVA